MRTLTFQTEARERRTVPLETGFDELDGLTATYGRLEPEHKQAMSEWRALNAELAKAREEDRERLADALIEGAPAPKATSLEAAQKKADEAERRAAALEIGLRKVAARIAELIGSSPAAWTEQVDEQLDAAREAFLAWVDQGGELVGRLVEAHALASWLASANGLGFKQPMLLAEELIGRNGEAFHVQAVLAGLRSVALPKEPTEATTSGGAFGARIPWNATATGEVAE